MQVVSDGFKKAIKSDNREIYGYAEVIYDEKDNQDQYFLSLKPNASILSLEAFDNREYDDIVDGNRLMKNYATLENNYFLLDGSFILPNSNTLYDAGGFISEQTFSNIPQDKKKIRLSTEEEGIETNGFTIFFKDNIPFDFDVIINELETPITINVRNNTKNFYQYIGTNKLLISNLRIDFINMEYNDRRIRIPDISMALVDLYQGNDLVSMNVEEAIDLFVESLPINTCTLNLNNYPDENGGMKFDPLNPQGIVPYLNENVIIKPYIGVLTEDNGVEYSKMGIFYLKDWSSNPDGNVTINGVSGMDKILNTTISETDNDSGFMHANFTINNKELLNRWLKQMTNFNFDIVVNGVVSNWFTNYIYLNKWLSTVLPFLIKRTNDDKTYYVTINRDNVLTNTNDIKDNPIENITRHELYNDVDFEIKKPIKKVELITYGWSSDGGVSKTVLNSSYTLSSNEEYVWFDKSEFSSIIDDPENLSYTTTGSGTATLIDTNAYLAYIKFTGDVGDVFSIELTSYAYPDNKPTPYTRVVSKDITDGDTITIDLKDGPDVVGRLATKVIDNYLNNNYGYKIKASTIGDPSLECGDKIAIQTRYNDTNDGYKNMVITKQKFTYDGGLKCEMEGMGN